MCIITHTTSIYGVCGEFHKQSLYNLQDDNFKISIHRTVKIEYSDASRRKKKSPMA
jgi:hypothetical protein